MLSLCKILQIIEKGENELVDFKAKHTECTAEFVHDILCLANAEGTENRYLIYGVEDSTSAIIGLSGNGKKENYIIDIMHSSMINHLPRIKLKTYKRTDGQNDIDVLIIEARERKPYFLLKDKECGPQTHAKHKGATVDDKQKSILLRAGVVYTRDGSINTSTNSTANELQIQSMWEERFGLRLPPLSRIQNYLEDTHHWKKTTNTLENRSSCSAYYKKFPEFTIESYESMEPSKQFYERWHTNQCCRGAPHELGVTQIALKYHSTILQRIELINAEYKYFFPIPTYKKPLDTNNPEAYIAQSSLEFKIAAIIGSSDINDNIKLQSYADELKDFFYLNRDEFLIDIID